MGQLYSEPVFPFSNENSAWKKRKKEINLHTVALKVRRGKKIEI